MDQLIFIDTETTGNDVTKDRLCQVCYKTSSGEASGLFKPPVLISVKAQSITHITPKMVQNEEAFEGSLMKKELEELLQNGVMVAHNAIFDKAMLEAEGLKINRFICTLRVARYLDEENIIPEYNLQYLRYYLDLNVEALPHDAAGDVKVLHALFNRLFQKMQNGGLTEEQIIDKMIEISSKPSVFKKFNFGKYDGKEIAEVIQINRGYLEWFLKQKMDEGGGDEDWIHTMKTYLNS